MKIKILGSAAAEAIPCHFCGCRVCEAARINRGKDLRRRTSYLIDEDTLVDYGPDINWQFNEFKIDSQKLDRVLITHLHEDHIDPTELIWRRNGFARQPIKQIKLYASENVHCRIIGLLAFDGACRSYVALGIDPVSVYPDGSTKYREDDKDFKLTAFLANHAPGMNPCTFIVERSGKKLFICNDTGYFSEQVWEKLRDVRADAIVIDCTCGCKTKNIRNGHMSGDVVLEVIDRMRGIKALSDDALVVANHFSHNGDCTHADIEAFFNPHGIVAGYDGLEFEVGR